MQPFISRYTNKLDAKSRVSVPAPFREVLAAEGTRGFYCMQSAGHPSLICFGKGMLDDIAQKLKAYTPGSRDYMVLGAYASQATVLSFDDEGRVRLPDDLIAHARLTERVLFNGVMDIFEVWEPETFKPVEAQRLADMRKLLGLEGGA